MTLKKESRAGLKNEQQEQAHEQEQVQRHQQGENIKKEEAAPSADGSMSVTAAYNERQWSNPIEFLMTCIGILST